MILKDFFVLSLVSTLSLVTSQPTPEGRDSEITKFHVTSKIQLRYASTEVLSHMSNPSSEVQEVTFEIRLPEKAFIHAFSMMVNGTEHVAKVEAKEKARETYLRGESLQTNDDITYLSAHGFNNKLVSLEVSSGCCWLIFSEPNFGGETKLFPEGKYQSVSSVGNLFRAASSVRKTTC